MTQQEIIEQNVRLTLGDLTLQLIIARAAQQAMGEELAALKAKEKPDAEAPAKRNGKDSAEARQPSA